MNKKLFGFFILIIAVASLGVIHSFSNTAVFAESATTPVAISYDSALHTDLQDVQDFTIFHNQFIAIQNNLVISTDLSNNTSTQLQAYSNASKLTSNNQFVAFLENQALVLLDTTLTQQQLTFNGSTVSFVGDLFAIYTNNNLHTLALLSGTTLQLVQFNNLYEITSQQSLSLNTITTPTGITLSSEYVYIADRTGANSSILLISLSNISLQNKYNTGLLNTSDIAFANLYDNNLIFSINQNNIMLNVASIDSSNETTPISNLTSLTSSGILTPSFLIGDLSEIHTIQVVNNTVYILDTINKTLQSFALNQTQDTYSLQVQDILIASSGYSLGRFFVPNDIYVASNDSYVVADTQNNRLQTIANQEIEQYKSATNLQNNTTTYNYPASVAKDSNNNFVIYNQPLGQNQVIVANNNLMLASISTYYYNSQSLALGTLSNLTLNAQDSIFALDITNNNILMSQNNSEFQVLKNAPFATALNATSKIIATNNQLVVLHDDVLYLLDETATTQNTYALTTSATDFDIDFMQNIYVLTQTGIDKLTLASNQISLDTTLTIDTPSNYSILRVAKDTGKLVLYHLAKEQIFTLQNSDFSNGLTNYEHPVQFTTLAANTTQTQIATTTQPMFVYDYPYYTGASYTLQTNQVVYVLDSQNGFDYVLYNRNNTLVAGYLATNSTTAQNTTTNTTTVNTVNTTVALFKYPTLLQTQSQQALILQTVAKDTSLTVYNQAITSLDGSTYYPVLLDNVIAYVNVADVVQNNQTGIVALTPTNAQTFSMTGQTTVYTAASTASTAITELQNFTNITVITENETDTFSKIIYKNDQNQEITGYILTKNIWDQQDTSNNVTAIILISCGLLLLGAITFSAYKIKKDKEW